ncbi:hypothetical protein BDY17DRAFT_327018 [Neohortaea acidophila]|uniref:BIR-domain-containing protein n=1 Tax=Neohortaea acidophila TaxID=245834 RepID=A0A6A6PK06_9PEZI|nr:uncharacterized protein BDY17DRAFT_327018 [Neohortaea acidophila]KAF2480031.1 hypothetical protein BDY17DRAFT_327018 [Neohortaea acidophila]
MQSFNARLETFEISHQLTKRRASNAKKKGGSNSIEWPHTQPAPKELARAGFFYHPSQASPDNVQCFLCAVKLDGWEADDDPVKEHLAHSQSCAWAQALNAGLQARHEESQQNPVSEELVAVRKATFDVGAGWPHESKRGWKCKVSKMVEAGWCMDLASPSEDEGADGVTCFYCDLSLDGWEPKDDPMAEHRRRRPECPFLALLEKYGAGAEASDSKKAKGKGRGKAGARTSAAGHARLSLQSVQSTFSEAPSLASIATDDADSQAGVDDSIMSTASQATITGPTKTKKKASRAKAAAKGTKGRKRANTVESEADNAPLYPELAADVDLQGTAETMQAQIQPEPQVASTKPSRKGGRQSKQPLDSSVVEISALEAAPPKKATRGKKAKAQPEPEALAELDADRTEVSTQLQEELERSMDMDAMEAVPSPAPTKRGVKRTSDGLAKKPEETVTASVNDFPAPPVAAPVAKAKKTRKASAQIVSEPVHEDGEDIKDDPPVLEAEAESAKPTKGKKAAPKKGTKGRKASSTRSSRASKATVLADSEPAQDDEAEDMERDEREIEAELQRIAAEQAIQLEQDQEAEFEPSPSHAQRRSDGIRQLEAEIEAEAQHNSPVDTKHASGKSDASSSPTSSDKENHPSSTTRQSPKLHPIAPTPVFLSPTKTTRIPLAPGTPNRLLSPTKAHPLHRSPSKQQIAGLATSHPWEAADLDAIFAASPQPTPGTLTQRLAGAAAGVLTSPEKGMTVEEWMRSQAEKGEAELRRRCEEVVGMFEREGLRALRSLEGVEVVSA